MSEFGRGWRISDDHQKGVPLLLSRGARRRVQAMTERNCYIGIDPGASGAIAFLFSSGAIVEKLKDMTDKDIVDLLADTSMGWDATAIIENVHAMPKQGVSSTFKFGVNFGSLCMALTAAGIPFERVTPQIWQRAMGCLSKGDKNVTKRKAQELFPDLKITHATADALLIAEYCRRVAR